MIRRLLLPLDGSDRAASILPCVQGLARLSPASITLLQVVEPCEAGQRCTGQHQASGSWAIAAADERAARAYLASVAQRLAGAGLVVQRRVVVGPAAEMIVRVAAGFDLIAMATHGRTGLDRWAHGSVADQVVRGAAAPVLLVRAGSAGAPVACPLRRLLVPLDGSALAEQALPLASSLARQAGADILLLHSLDWMHLAAGASPDSLGVGDGDGPPAAAAAGTRAYLAGIAARLMAQGIATRTEIRRQPAATGILTAASEHGADLIVMRTHGRSGISRWLLGSVADGVLHRAAIPLLLVRGMVRVEAASPTAVPVGGALPQGRLRHAGRRPGAEEHEP